MKINSQSIVARVGIRAPVTSVLPDAGTALFDMENFDYS